MSFFKKLFIIATLFISLISDAWSQTFKEFKSPAPANRPITYWMWLNGNITKEGITKDLEAMKSSGINGTLMFSVGFYQPGPVKPGATS